MKKLTSNELKDLHSDCINRAAHNIALIAESIEHGRTTKTQAGAIYTAIAELTKALRNAGYATEVTL